MACKWLGARRKRTRDIRDFIVVHGKIVNHYQSEERNEKAPHGSNSVTAPIQTGEKGRQTTFPKLLSTWSRKEREKKRDSKAPASRFSKGVRKKTPVLVLKDGEREGRKENVESNVCVCEASQVTTGHQGLTTAKKSMLKSKAVDSQDSTINRRPLNQVNYSRKENKSKSDSSKSNVEFTPLRVGSAKVQSRSLRSETGDANILEGMCHLNSDGTRLRLSRLEKKSLPASDNFTDTDSGLCFTQLEGDGRCNLPEMCFPNSASTSSIEERSKSGETLPRCTNLLTDLVNHKECQRELQLESDRTLEEVWSPDSARSSVTESDEKSLLPTTPTGLLTDLVTCREYGRAKSGLELGSTGRSGSVQGCSSDSARTSLREVDEKAVSTSTNLLASHKERRNSELCQRQLENDGEVIYPNSVSRTSPSDKPKLDCEPLPTSDDFSNLVHFEEESNDRLCLNQDANTPPTPKSLKLDSNSHDIFNSTFFFSLSGSSPVACNTEELLAELSNCEKIYIS